MARDYNPARYRRANVDPGYLTLKENIELREKNAKLQKELEYYKRFRTELLYYIAGEISHTEAQVADADCRERVERLIGFAPDA